MKHNNKFESNNQYFTISIYAFFVIVASLLFYKVIANWAETSNFLKTIFRVLSPFIFAFLIAYLIHPLTNWIEKNIIIKLGIGKFKIKNFKLQRILSIIIVYLIVIGFLALTLIYVIPQVANSLREIVDKVYNYINDLSDDSDEIIDILLKNFYFMNSASAKNLIDDYIPNFLEEVGPLFSGLIPFLYGLSMNIISSFITLLLSLVIAFYLLVEKELFLKKSKQVIYAYLSQKNASKLLEIFRDCNRIFRNFIVGKSLDSLIIGFMCFIILVIANIPYALLISVIVGITNMIPYFGPFIGAVPGLLIILITDPSKAIWFLIIIFALQQFDGLYLGPKILGDSTGLRPFWVIFSIVIGGALLGPLGMFLGVPIFAVINYLINKNILKRLEKKNLLE